jgi:hypothetical protein
MVHRCKIPLSLHRHLAQSLHQVVLHRHLAVNLPHLAQSLPQAVNLPPVLHLLLVQHKLLLAILQDPLQQINLLRKVAVVNPKQAKLKQQVIATAKQGLV